MAARKTSSGGRRSTSSTRRKTNTQKRTSGRKRSRKADFNENGLQDEIVILVLIAVAIMLFLSNLKIMGTVGDIISGVQFGLFGLLAYLFPIIFAAFVIMLYFFIGNPRGPFKMFISGVLFLDVCAISHMFVLDEQLAAKENAFVFCKDNLKGGGIFGAFFAKMLTDFLDKAGAWILLILIMFICLMILTGVSLFKLIDVAGNMIDEGAQKAIERSDERYERRISKKEEELERRNRRKKKREELDNRRAAIEEQEDKKPRRQIKQEGFDLSNSSIPKRRSTADTSEITYFDEESGEILEDEYLDSDNMDSASEMDHPVIYADGTDLVKGVEPRRDAEMKAYLESEMERRFSTATETAEYSESDLLDNGESDYDQDYFDDGWNDEEDEFGSSYANDDKPNFSVDDLSSQEFYFDNSEFLERTESQRGSAGHAVSVPPVVKSAASATGYMLGSGTEDDFGYSNTDCEEPDYEPNYDEAGYEEFGYEEAGYEETGYEEAGYDEARFEEAGDEEIDSGKEDDEGAGYDETGFGETSYEAEVHEIPVPAEVTVETAGSDSIFRENTSSNGQRSSSSGVQHSKAVAKKEDNSTKLPFILRKKWRLPGKSDYASLFSVPDKKSSGDSHSEVEEMKETIRDVLDSFGVSIEPEIDVTRGPAVTRFEIAPVRGVKVSKILNLEHDIMLGLAAESLRIEAPIPGVSRVGLEIPNRKKESVAFSELLRSREFIDFPGKLAFAVGRGMSGERVIHDISKMPHVLVAGATGSGKSVCINTIIISLLMKYTPQQLRLYMVDPKVVELSVYNDIPHLYGQNVVTDPGQASAMLKSVVLEMDDRYKKFAEAKVRDIKGYNQKVLDIAGAESINDYYGLVRAGKIQDQVLNRPMPHIVVIIDELADLMMTAGKEVEASIVRIAQLARACGIHLVIATQRPSVDVVTGLIKANMPSRIAFAVSSGTDSRTILDAVGAEKLLGMGDMLFYPSGKNHPERVQGAYVSDEEVQNVIDFWVGQMNENEQGELKYLQENDKVSSQNNIKQGNGDFAGQSHAEAGDEYIVDAARFIIQSKKASIGMLQRKFKIGFNRAARIMDSLHDAGVVGDEEGTKSRKILIEMDQLENMIEAGEL